MKSYIICAIARSGSNYLCELLASLGYAGRPYEHLWDPPGIEPEPLTMRWPRVLREGASQNGVFGTKILWYQMRRLEDDLPATLGAPGEPLDRVLAATLHNPSYIYLTRHDHLRQAVSFARALQTKQWRSMDTVQGELRYNPDAITEGLRQIDREEAYWKDFFACTDISPYRIYYEELDTEPGRVVAGILQFLGHGDGSSVGLLPAEHQRQADEVSEEWVARYRRDIEASRLP